MVIILFQLTFNTMNMSLLFINCGRGAAVVKYKGICGNGHVMLCMIIINNLHIIRRPKNEKNRYAYQWW